MTSDQRISRLSLPDRRYSSDATRTVFSFSSDAQQALDQLAGPAFRNGHLVAGNLAPLLVGSSSCGQVIFGGGQIEAWTQFSGNHSVAAQEGLALSDGSQIRRGYAEGMVVQAAHDLPGVVIDNRREKTWVNLDSVPAAVAQQVEDDFGEIFNQRTPLSPEQAWGILGRYAMNTAYCEGLYGFLARGFGTPDQAVAVKGQQTGVVTLGMELLTPDGRRALAHPKYLTLAMAAMLRGESQRVLLAEHTGNPNTVIFNDEPDLMTAWSGAGGVDEETISALLRLQQEANLATTGTHCCGPTNIQALVASGVQILNLNLTGADWEGDPGGAEYADAFVAVVRQEERVRQHLREDGFLAMGIVTFDQKVSAEQTVALGASIIRRTGIDPNRCLVTPVCGAGPQTSGNAAAGFNKLPQVCLGLQQEFGLVQ